MSLSDRAVAVLGALWAEQDEAFAREYRALLGRWRDYALAHPDEAITQGLPWRDPLRRLIERGVVQGAADMLSLFAAEAGLRGGTERIMSTIADHFGRHAVQIAGDLDGSIGAAAQGAARVALEAGMGERDAAGILLRRYGSLGEHRARTIARTELTNGAALARVGAFGAVGRTVFEYRSILDDATTDTCSGLDGVVLDMLDPLARQLTPAAHFRCRALLVPAAPGTRPAGSAALRRLLAVRAAEFPGWESRLAPTVARLLGVGA